MLQEGQKFGGGYALEAEGVDVLEQELVEAFPSHSGLQQLNELGALLVWHQGIHLVRIDPVQVIAQVTEWGALAQLIQIDLEGVAAHHTLEVGELHAVDLFQDAALGVDREALVEPEIVHGGVGHQVAGPAVGQFVGYYVDLAAVASQQGGREEGEARILHAAVRKCGRHDEHVETRPIVGAEQLLR